MIGMTMQKIASTTAMTSSAIVPTQHSQSGTIVPACFAVSDAHVIVTGSTMVLLDGVRKAGSHATARSGLLEQFPQSEYEHIGVVVAVPDRALVLADRLPAFRPRNQGARHPSARPFVLPVERVRAEQAAVDVAFGQGDTVTENTRHHFGVQGMKQRVGAPGPRFDRRVRGLHVDAGCGQFQIRQQTNVPDTQFLRPGELGGRPQQGPGGHTFGGRVRFLPQRREGEGQQGCYNHVLLHLSPFDEGYPWPGLTRAPATSNTSWTS